MTIDELINKYEAKDIPFRKWREKYQWMDGAEQAYLRATIICYQEILEDLRKLKNEDNN